MKRNYTQMRERSWKPCWSYFISLILIIFSFSNQKEFSWIQKWNILGSSSSLIFFVQAKEDITSDINKRRNQSGEEGTSSHSQNALRDDVEDGFFDPISPDPSCTNNVNDTDADNDCWNPPTTTIEKEAVVIDATAMYGGDDPSDCYDEDEESGIKDDKKICKEGVKTKIVDKHWGSDENTLKMRDQLRNAGKASTGSQSFDQKRPPIFLMPGLASTR